MKCEYLLGPTGDTIRDGCRMQNHYPIYRCALRRLCLPTYRQNIPKNIPIRSDVQLFQICKYCDRTPMATAKLTWAYGITTVKDRADTLLPQTLASLARAGFPDPVIFMDGEPIKLGFLPNWQRTLATLYFATPTADRFAVFEDDLLACSHLREYLDACPFPQKGYWNLLTHDQNLAFALASCNAEKVPFTPGWHLSNQRGRGAVGLVFDREGVLSLLSDRFFLERRIKKGNQPTDGLVMDTLQRQGYKEWVHYPSLLDHVGLKSVIGHRYGRMKAFKGEDYNPMEIL